MGTSWMYTRSSGRKIESSRTCRVPSISCFFASLVSPGGPVMMTTGMDLLLRSGFWVARLSGPRPIAQDDDAGAECLRADQLQSPVASLAEEQLAPAREERMNPELDLIDQAPFQQ